MCSKCAAGLSNLFMAFSPSTTQAIASESITPAVPVNMDPPASSSDIFNLEKNLAALLNSKFGSIKSQLLALKL